jgi:hypothetical protein
MSSYIPGAGLKKPMNQLETPVYPDIKKSPGRFVWARKNWKVDTGETMKQVEHIPQMTENAVLFQSRDYNSQHAYGNYPKFNKGQWVNLEFRPPMQDRDDFLPLSRIPRPLTMPRINPGAAFSSGGSSFSQQNMGMSQVGKFISDRVKEGEIRPTFFAPISMPDDNSVLPDLELKMPAVSAGAGFKFPNAANNGTIEDDGRKYSSLSYNRAPVSAVAGFNPSYTQDGPDARSNMEFGYARPQVSASAGHASRDMVGLTPVDMDLDYNRPQVSASARERFTATPGLTPVDIDLEYNRPQVSAVAGYNSQTVYDGQSSVDHLIRGNGEHLDYQTVGADSGSNLSPIYDMNQSERQAAGGVDRNMTDRKANVSYVVPANTYYEARNTASSATPAYREKQRSIGTHHASFSTQGHVRRAGFDQPQQPRMRAVGAGK